MKIISWNVAGFRACLKKGFADFFEQEAADVYCLQETKALQEQIEFEAKGYHCFLNAAKRKGYSGTIIYTKQEPISVVYGIGEEVFDDEGRTITAEYEDFYLVNIYVPNVKRDLSRLDERMKWEDLFREYLLNLNKKKPVVVCGDFNVAHEEIDLKNPKSNIGNAGFTYEERAKMTELLGAGFIDTFRHFNKDVTDVYSWWSYMHGAREKNIGWRIDYFLVSNDFINNVKNTKIYTDVYGSDHCPVGIEI